MKKNSEQNKWQTTYFGNRKALLAQLTPEFVAPIIKRAERITQNEFVFDSPWDMEACQTPVHFEQVIDWHHIHANDPEWMFMLNRHGFFVDLAIAYVATQKEKYLITLQSLWRSWLAKECDGEKLQDSTWRSLDVGIRIKNWIKTIDLLGPQTLPEPLCSAIQSSIGNQCAFLCNHHQPLELQSNWLILAFHGVYIATTYLSILPSAEKWRDQAVSLLQQCATLQLFPDGMHWEQSTMYHHEVMMNLCEAYMIAQRHGDDRLAGLKPLIQKMLSVSLALTPPDLLQLPTGDSDVEAVRGVQNFARLLLGQAPLVGTTSTDQLLTMTLYGALPNAIEFVSSNQRLDTVLATSGHVIVRSDTSAMANWLHFKNGFIGSGHGHADLLHVDLYVHGHSLFIDPGRYTYRANDPLRQVYKAATAHNTIVVNQQEFTTQKHAWSTASVATPIQLPQIVNQQISVVQGMHLGYYPTSILKRKLIYIKPSLFICFDMIKQEQETTIDRYFHIAPNVQVTADPDGFDFADEQATFLARLHMLGGGKRELGVAAISPHYNQQIDAPLIKLSESVGKQAILPWVVACLPDVGVEVLPVMNPDGSVCDPTYTQAIKLTIGDEYWLVIENAFELPYSRKLQVVDDVPVFGQTVVVHQRGDTQDITTLM